MLLCRRNLMCKAVGSCRTGVCIGFRPLSTPVECCPIYARIAEVKLTHVERSDQGEREGDLPPRRPVLNMQNFVRLRRLPAKGEVQWTSEWSFALRQSSCAPGRRWLILQQW